MKFPFEYYLANVVILIDNFSIKTKLKTHESTLSRSLELCPTIRLIPGFTMLLRLSGFTDY
jgi:hypothetical protein